MDATTPESKACYSILPAKDILSEFYLLEHPPTKSRPNRPKIEPINQHQTQRGVMATVQKVSSDFAKDYEVAENVLRDCVADNRRPSFEEAQFMQRLGWDEKQQIRQLGRIASVLQWQSIAGTSTAREALAESVNAAETALNERRPAIEEKIQALQKELSQLERDHTTQAKRLTEANQAASSLKQLVPAHIVAKSNSLLTLANETIGREYHEMLGQISHMECLIDPARHADEKAYQDVVASYDSAYVLFDVHQDTNAHIRPEHRGGGWRVNYRFSEDWEPHRQSLEAELPGLRKQVNELKEQFDAERDKSQEPLQIYWR